MATILGNAVPESMLLSHHTLLSVTNMMHVGFIFSSVPQDELFCSWASQHQAFSSSASEQAPLALQFVLTLYLAGTGAVLPGAGEGHLSYSPHSDFPGLVPSPGLPGPEACVYFRHRDYQVLKGALGNSCWHLVASEGCWEVRG